MRLSTQVCHQSNEFYLVENFLCVDEIPVIVCLPSRCESHVRDCELQSPPNVPYDVKSGGSQGLGRTAIYPRHWVHF